MGNTKIVPKGCESYGAIVDFIDANVPKRGKLFFDLRHSNLSYFDMKNLACFFFDKPDSVELLLPLLGSATMLFAFIVPPSLTEQTEDNTVDLTDLPDSPPTTKGADPPKEAELSSGRFVKIEKSPAQAPKLSRSA